MAARPAGRGARRPAAGGRRGPAAAAAAARAASPGPETPIGLAAGPEGGRHGPHWDLESPTVAFPGFPEHAGAVSGRAFQVLTTGMFSVSRKKRVTMPASLLFLASLVPGVMSFVIPSYSTSSLIALSHSKTWCPSPSCTVFRNAMEIPISTRMRLRLPSRKLGLPAPLRMSTSESCVSKLEEAFEAALISSLPEADEAQLEELLAILTTTARSLERRLKQGQVEASTAQDRLTSSLR